MLDRIVGLRRVGAGLEQARLRSERRPRPERGAPPHRRPRARESRRSSPRSTGTAAPRWPRPTNGVEQPFLGAPGLARRREARREERGDEAATVRDRSRDGALRGREGHQERAQAQPPRPLHDEQAAAGRRQPPGLRRQARDADRAGALRGRRPRQGRRRRSASSRTCAPTRRACRRTRSRPRASYVVASLRQGVGPRAAQHLQVEEELAGRARGHPPDVAGADARERAPAPEGRAVQALQADLGALRRLPDDARRLRPDEHRHRGEAPPGEHAPTACGRAAASSSSAAGSRPTERARSAKARRRSPARAREADARRRAAQAKTANGARHDARRTCWPRTPRRRCPSSTRGRRCASSRRRASSPSRSSRSPRRATARPRSCASSKSAASAGPAPTPRSSARCRRATTSRRSTATRFRPTTARQVRRRRPGQERARFHGSGLHVEDGGGARRGRGRQGGARRLAEALLQALPRAARLEQEGQALESRARADRARSASSTAV